MGRKTQYDQAIFKPLVIEGIAAGRSLRSLCRQDGWPDPGMICKWLVDDVEFAQHYARARESDGHATGEEVGELARAILRGEVPPDVGRVAGDLLKWTAARKAPKVYGEKMQAEVTGANGGEIVHKIVLENLGGE